MKKHIPSLLLLLIVSGVTVQPLAAQGGGVIDWIHRLSGPSMLGPAASYFWEGESVRLRVNLAGRLAVGFKDSTLEPDHGINQLALQPTIEVPLIRLPKDGSFELGTGFAINRFGGDSHDAVWHFTIPFFGQFRFPVNVDETWFLRVGVGGHYFPSFDDTDFVGSGDEPGVTVETDGGELTFGMILGLDFKKKN